MLHVHFSSIELPTSSQLISQQLPVPVIGADATVRIMSRWLPADLAAALPMRSIRLRRDILLAACDVVQRSPGIPQYTTLAAERQRIKRLVIATALAMQGEVSNG
jgi:hypothetical protein